MDETELYLTQEQARFWEQYVERNKVNRESRCNLLGSDLENMMINYMCQHKVTKMKAYEHLGHYISRKEDYQLKKAQEFVDKSG